MIGASLRASATPVFRRVPGAAHLVVDRRSRARLRDAKRRNPVHPRGLASRSAASTLDWRGRATPAEILRALDVLSISIVAAAAALAAVPARDTRSARRRGETRDDPEYRANLHATAFAVGLALLGFGLVLQTFFRAN